MMAGRWRRWLAPLTLCCAALAARAHDLPLAPDAGGALVVVAVDNPQPSLPLGAGAYRARARYLRSAQAAADLQALQQAHGLSAVEQWPIELLGWHCAVLRVPPGTEPEALLQRLKEDPRVRLAQPLQQFQTLTQPPAAPAAAPNDPYLPLQANLVSLSALPAAARSSGRGVTVALIDTGVALRHPDLQGRRIERRNVVDSDETAYEGDLHGTQMAGVMVATVNNALGIAGIAPEAKVLAIKACWHPPEASRRATCNSFTLAQGLAAAVKGGAQVINLSLGGPNDPLLARLAAAAQDRGISVVGAAPEPGVQRGFPVDVPGVIEVAAAEQGAGAAQVLRAPGRDILTLSAAGHYDFASGSSLAAAQASAIAALLLQHEPGLRPARLAALLRQSQRGAGLINACAALAALRQGLGCAASP